ncbi:MULTISPECIES: Mce protein [unclassified Mycobacterium]|uniref:Mce protein n=1 Tax=unclassified Mycobacterium TaxID=2642494 RepID=UPI0007FC09D5|nr:MULTISPECIES: Mce protein [unclassified Mycobacterium]OBG78629.1 Mce protein [Mycobacterium sp. E1214]OBH27479.1 Mce protein [Mycobacterium sp. E1319]
MEGDAGASRLNPPPMPKFGRSRRRRLKTPEEPVVGAADPQTGDVADEQDSTRSDDASDEASDKAPETAQDAVEDPPADGDPATSVADTVDPDDAEEPTDPPAGSDATDTPAERPASRLGRGWLVGIAAALLLGAGGIGAGGYLALRSHQESQAIARNDAAALKAAVDCVSATQAPDTNAMNASEQKIIDCGTDNFRSQALLYTSMLVQAYQAANIHVQVADARAAVERNNRDGSIDVLVALRVKVASDQAQNETGYRLRVKMALAEGQYKISKLDQVTK